ncbi:carbohydrate porin [Cerasicoccus fimbriatus]|uniref:carbohydrate porin n=1 Tax=Cerasicoccus fimbriatus TaxID=3014554 RepID=UPI0022B5427F|nr:carbohydrate porin [Cerasicoccus sp. TK19100]
MALALLGSAAQAVEVGDTRAAVIEELGFPIGQLDLGDRQRLMFDAGDITLVDGVVTVVNLKSTAQLKRDAEAKENMAAYWAERRAEDLAERLDHGRMWLDYLELESTPITENDVKAIMGHWNQLRKDHPEADIVAEYDATLALAEARAAEIKQRREEQRLAALERRVAAAEQRAAAAEEQASNFQRYTYTYPAYYYPQPRTVVVIGNGGAYCPPQAQPKQPGLSASYSSGNFSVNYSSVGSRYCNPYPSNPIVITRNNPQ